MTIIMLVVGVVVWPEMALAFVLFSNGHEIIGLLAAFMGFRRMVKAVPAPDVQVVEKIVEKVRVVEKIVYREAKMSTDDAYAALGVKAGVSKETLRTAYRTMMARVHPDQGGSNYLAAKVNEAKQLLLGR